MYARGILFGKMKYELGDHSYVRCPENKLVADVDFKVKGYFSGAYNAIGGTIKNEATGEIYYELSGYWNGEMYIRNVVTGKKELLFDATNAKHTPPLTRPLEEQEPRESQKLWYNTTQALLARNHELATEEKTKIEDQQREEAAQRIDGGVEWRPRLFRRVKGGPGGPEEGEEDLDWIINAHVDSKDPKLATRQILAIAPILKGQAVDHQFDIPPHCSSSHQNCDGASGSGSLSVSEAKNTLIDLGNDAEPASDPAKKKTAEKSEDLLGDIESQVPNADSSTMNTLKPTTTNTIRRRDSVSSGVDEFVDARD
ncbi:Oxysterol-binding protein OBPa [Ophidiomyces ophidiicola]|uniref:Oxysterol-binding protein OBPa n=1 Tax=Ophidiomyces ophidiicola TaxID=1387563 RepID=A0ACB8UY65_9EURO|nr:Oxysterol-binding protein OBPa [Ophidiomyces ophidiicola]KAI1911378.1 Oxysterol-binding protein OBPa [Ophidiomyces ophidiicola]KAI1918474.1 Oxysterol-binding protein OBPa [Ophidiomyces ophidiicola]KAI1926833.1 Oxysterol-binding protein OBPa [Ophidiomyces ophidiicola]KAI1947362.1 Oxysterol-binding protein OBPa [Ophidiomyces ophidiicola]KAI1951880.1 Oxysterol-binding protein OBPa [Ophidiomyces ophidiicola]